MRPCHFFQHLVSVRGNGRLVSSLFHQCTSFCIKCMLCNRQPPLISFKRDKNMKNVLVRSVLKSDDQLGTFKCAWKRRNTCPVIHNADKITGPKRSIKITNRFSCTSANVIYCITCTLYGGQSTLSTQLINPNFVFKIVFYYKLVLFQTVLNSVHLQNSTVFKLFKIVFNYKLVQFQTVLNSVQLQTSTVSNCSK